MALLGMFLVLLGAHAFLRSAYSMCRRRAEGWRQLAAQWEDQAREAVKDRNMWIDMLLGRLEAHGDNAAGKVRHMLREQAAVTAHQTPAN